VKADVRCPACATDIPFGAANGVPQWGRCPRCRLMVRHPMPSPRELEEMYATAYSPTAVKLDSTGFESDEEMLGDLTALLEKRFLRPGDRLLDFGAGSGRLCKIMRDAGFEIDGVELSSQARVEAKTRFGFEFRSTLAEMPENYYDWVIAIEVLEHLPDPGHTLNELRARLKPGGALFLTTPNARGLRARLEGLRWREAVNPFHLVLFTRPAAEMLLTRAGFERVRHISFSPIGSAYAWRGALHRALQLVGLYGGLRIVGYRPAT
jgi:SAM-dependent methyltransferase